MERGAKGQSPCEQLAHAGPGVPVMVREVTYQFSSGAQMGRAGVGDTSQPPLLQDGCDFFFFFFFLVFRAAPVAYARSLGRGRIPPLTAGLHHRPSKAGS